VTSGLLALVLQSMGVAARSWQGWQIPLHTDAAHRTARITSIDVGVLKARMLDGEVAVVAGFQGVAPGGRIATLGRGGSDTSAVALAAALAADRCDIYTDVDGVYTTDPRVVAKAHRLDRISYEEMLEMASQGAKVLQTRSVELAMQKGVRLLVRSSFDAPETAGEGETGAGVGTLVCHEDEIVEQNVVSGIAYARDEAKVTLLKVADKPGVAARVFGPLAEAHINVDMIVQNVSEDGRHTDLTFTVQNADFDRALEGVGHWRRDAEPRRGCRADVQRACRKGHQYRGDLDIRDQNQRIDRCSLCRACGTDPAFLVRIRQPIAGELRSALNLLGDVRSAALSPVGEDW
jgi:aspartate kinase